MQTKQEAPKTESSLFTGCLVPKHLVNNEASSYCDLSCVRVGMILLVPALRAEGCPDPITGMYQYIILSMRMNQYFIRSIMPQAVVSNSYIISCMRR